jgi:hypothetical protein
VLRGFRRDGNISGLHLPQNVVDPSGEVVLSWHDFVLRNRVIEANGIVEQEDWVRWVVRWVSRWVIDVVSEQEVCDGLKVLGKLRGKSCDTARVNVNVDRQVSL